MICNICLKETDQPIITVDQSTGKSDCICEQCEKMLAYSNRDINTLARAILYLKEFK